VSGWSIEQLDALLPQVPATNGRPPVAPQEPTEPPENLPLSLVERANEECGANRSEQHFALVAACVDAGYDDEAVVAIVLNHKPTVDKYADPVAEAYRSLGKLRAARGPVVVKGPTRGDERFFVDWPEFWARDRRDADWAYEDVLARGRGHAIFAGHKVGKSLLVLFLVAQLVADGFVVLYLDYEMGEDDLHDRLDDMGYGPETDFSRLRYALLPSLPPLDEPEGAKALFAKLGAVAAEFPDRGVVVVIDTTGRAVVGEENSADTYRNFYRWTGIGLKQRDVTWVRLDHAGKDTAKGQRGSSGKGDDVDVVWRLVRVDGGLELRREASRMGWVPERVAFRQTDDPLRFVRVDEAWPAGTKETAEALAALGVSPEVGYRPAAKCLKAVGKGRRADLVAAAQKWRRETAKGLGEKE